MAVWMVPKNSESSFTHAELVRSRKFTRHLDYLPSPCKFGGRKRCCASENARGARVPPITRALRRTQVTKGISFHSRATGANLVQALGQAAWQDQAKRGLKDANISNRADDDGALAWRYHVPGSTGLPSHQYS